MATMITQELVEAQEANDTVRDFMRRFEVGKLLRSCRAQETKGFSVVELFAYLVCCMFSPISTYMSMRIGSYREAFSKNTLYRFCGSVGINWHKFVRLLSEKIIGCRITVFSFSLSLSGSLQRAQFLFFLRVY